jgi:hypothetical protein
MQVTHLDEEYEAEMLQSIRTIPASCSHRLIELNQTLWTQLDDNEWLYVASLPYTLTVLCSKLEPTDIEITDTGKLKLNSMCKGYGAKVLIQTQMII